MTLLKTNKPKSNNLTIGDGWNFGIGFGLAMTIAIPFILILLSCLIGIGVSILGGSITALLGG